MVSKKLAIISGVNRGLGAELMNQIFRINGFEIFAISRTFENVPSSDRIIKKQVDLSNLGDCKEFYSPVDFKKYQEVYFFNNASSVLPIGSIGSLSESSMKSTISLNTIAPILLINEIMKQMKDNLVLVNISSGAAKRPIVGWGIYCATKAANEIFFNVIELQEKNSSKIKVYNIDPGVMDTGMQDSIRNADEAGFPDKKDFLKFKRQSILRKPSVVATEILEKVGVL